MARLFSFEQEK